MMPDKQVSLADQIRDKLDAGLLPSVPPEKMWSAYGHDNPCSGCGEPIQPAQVEYEFRMHADSDDVFRLHIGCVGMWLAELRRRGLVTPDGTV
jgi:hypothetical protein